MGLSNNNITGKMEVLAGFYKSGFEDGPRSKAHFYAINDLICLPDDTIIVADAGTVRRISNEGT